jgi:hypothetical protein
VSPAPVDIRTRPVAIAGTIGSLLLVVALTFAYVNSQRTAADFLAARRGVSQLLELKEIVEANEGIEEFTYALDDAAREETTLFQSDAKAHLGDVLQPAERSWNAYRLAYALLVLSDEGVDYPPLNSVPGATAVVVAYPQLQQHMKTVSGEPTIDNKSDDFIGLGGAPLGPARECVPISGTNDSDFAQVDALSTCYFALG